MKAIIPAAGFGTRFLPATKAQPKEMLPIVDKPTIQFVVEEAITSGIEDILIITGAKKRAIEDHFDKCFELENHLEKKQKHEELKQIRELSDLIDIHYIRQKEQLGLGHAVLCAKKYLQNEPFAVLLGDEIIDSTTPCIKQLINCHNKTQSSIIGINSVPMNQVYKYGIVSGKEIQQNVFELTDLVEKPSVEEATSDLAITGRYVINPEIFDSLNQTPFGKGNELQLTDAFIHLLNHQKIYGHKFEGKRFDIGTKLDYLKAIIHFALKRDDLNTDFRKYLRTIT